MVSVEVKRAVSLGIDFFRQGTSDEKWRNRVDGTYYSGGYITGAVDLRDALQQFAALWDSEYGRQYVRATAEVVAACEPCHGSGTIQSKRSKYVWIKCKACRGQDSTLKLVEGVEYKRDA